MVKRGFLAKSAQNRYNESNLVNNQPSEAGEEVWR